jgi:hypothetical protein
VPRPPAHLTTQILEAALAVAGMLGFALLFGWTALHLTSDLTSGLLPWVVVGAFVGYLGADLFSGVVHWAFDTWGRADSLLLGDLFIRPFREHHSDPLAFTKRGFVIMNGYNALVCLPVLGIALWVLASQGVTATSAFVGAACLVGTLFVFLTNQFHAWAHVDDVPAIARVLQRMRIILTREEHDRHHTSPYLVGYCITSGWLNPVLERLRVFPALERVITAITGMRPRQDA